MKQDVTVRVTSYAKEDMAAEARRYLEDMASPDFSFEPGTKDQIAEYLARRMSQESAKYAQYVIDEFHCGFNYDYGIDRILDEVYQCWRQHNSPVATEITLAQLNER